jgi:hypothetical protein
MCRPSKNASQRHYLANQLQQRAPIQRDAYSQLQGQLLGSSCGAMQEKFHDGMLGDARAEPRRLLHACYLPQRHNLDRRHTVDDSGGVSQSWVSAWCHAIHLFSLAPYPTYSLCHAMHVQDTPQNQVGHMVPLSLVYSSCAYPKPYLEKHVPRTAVHFHVCIMSVQCHAWLRASCPCAF